MFAQRTLLVAIGLLCLSQFPSRATAQTFITAWGSYGTGEGQFTTPQGVAVGGSGDVYVSDGDNSSVQVFTSSGAYLRSWAVPDWTVGQALNIAVDANDNVYVASLSNHLIIKYTSTGIPVTQWGGYGPGPGQFGGLDTDFFSLAVDGAGNVYVADRGNNRIQVFTPLGAYVREWGATDPDGLAVDAGGNVYVADTDRRWIHKFSNSGSYITGWGGEGTGDGQFRGPVRVAIGPEGNVYVVDHLYDRVQAFTGDGAFITKWGSSGASEGEFLGPIGIAVDALGYIYVVDKNNRRIQKFGLAPTPVASVTWGSMKARYRAGTGLTR